MGGKGRRVIYTVTSLPYRARVYVNNQVLIPASLVRALGLVRYWYADITIRYNGEVVIIKHARLLRTRHTDARQFTIPRDVRERLGIRIFDEVEVLDIKPVSNARVLVE
ncbi:AbrB/MazE/SpoVT family DNA-binding domain-containing protein [Vulcanisaeta thermophila]|uniref:AbrB/MazE/SpoVT family DNA-binding domain-containing protein n=1 Tax=Vulcanisaeta thermophila TaxID=867917 RepID=UPI00085338A9|nr:AbrB/MazE/SpoVT family DNA-binding domain-containing protein [Vulcanisaeta thermophila]